MASTVSQAGRSGTIRKSTALVNLETLSPGEIQVAL